MNTLKKTIWFDQNSEPQKSYIWYRGEGKFYEYSGGNWVLTYDLANTPTQSELNEIAESLSNKTGKTVENNLSDILAAMDTAIEKSKNTQIAPKIYLNNGGFISCAAEPNDKYDYFAFYPDANLIKNRDNFFEFGNPNKLTFYANDPTDEMMEIEIIRCSFISPQHSDMWTNDLDGSLLIALENPSNFVEEYLDTPEWYPFTISQEILDFISDKPSGWLIIPSLHPTQYQGDYIIIASQYADTIEHDAAALGTLAGHLEKGTVFDVIVKEGDYDLSHIVSCYTQPGSVTVGYYNLGGSTFKELDILYTQSQYEGLAAIQRTCGFDFIPELQNNEGYLCELSVPYYLCCDGKLVLVDVDVQNGVLARLIFTNDVPEDDYDWVDISADDLQKLVGLPIS